MNSLLKKIVVLFTIIAVLVLIVFAIQLFVLNRNSDDEPENPSPPTDTLPSGTPDGTATGDPTGTPDDDDPAASGDGEETPEVPTGTRYDMAMPDGSVLILFADDALFSRTLTEESDIYTYLGGGTASLEIKLVTIFDDAAGFAAGFLNEYIDYTGGEHSSDGMSLIGKSDITGRSVSASKDGETYEAWIIEFDGDDAGIGFAVIVNYRDDAQKAALYRILDTLELNES